VRVRRRNGRGWRTRPQHRVWSEPLWVAAIFSAEMKSAAAITVGELAGLAGEQR
jgi:hypothetical protein